MRISTLPSRATGFIAPRPKPRIATSGLFTIGVKCAPPIAPWLEIVNVPPFSSSGHLPVARLLRELFQLLRQIQHRLFIHVTNDRHDQALFRVHGNADVKILFEDNFIGYFIETGIENRMLL